VQSLIIFVAVKAIIYPIFRAKTTYVVRTIKIGTN